MNLKLHEVDHNDLQINTEINGMATLIPSIGTSAFDSSGERRLAERLEQKLDDDYLLWHNVHIGPKQTYPYFVVLHHIRGLLILETKDWQIDTIKAASKCGRRGQCRAYLSLQVHMEVSQPHSILLFVVRAIASICGANTNCEKRREAYP